MAESRYSVLDNRGGSVTNQSGASQSNQTQNTNSTSTSTGSQTQTTDRQIQNIDDQSFAALQYLIQQLLGGGTPEQVQDRAARNLEIQQNQAFRGQYDKADAFADAQGAMAQLLQQAMERALPTLARAAEGAGTSQNSMRALLTQDALNRAAQSSAALGLGAASDYGRVAAGFSQILEALTRPDDPTTQALINALNIAKGAFTTEQGTVQTDSTETTTSSGSQSSSSNQNQNQTTVQTPLDPYANINYGSIGGASTIGSSQPVVNDQVSEPTITRSGRSLYDIINDDNAWSEYYF